MAARSGSFKEWLSEFRLGECRYVETTIAEYAGVMRATSGQSRFPRGMEGYRFTALLYTAIAASNAADVRYLVRVERIQ